MKSPYYIDGIWYHGGSANAISQINSNRINTTTGGGELGVGFYVGNYGHEASAWARHKNRNDAVVVELSVTNFSKSGLKKLELSWLGAKEHYNHIRRQGQGRNFKFNKDVVAAPIVGKMFKDTPIQLKWEGQNSQQYLNSTAVSKKTTKL